MTEQTPIGSGFGMRGTAKVTPRIAAACTATAKVIAQPSRSSAVRGRK